MAYLQSGKASTDDFPPDDSLDFTLRQNGTLSLKMDCGEVGYLVVNNDRFVEPTWLKSLVSGHRKDKKVGFRLMRHHF